MSYISKNHISSAILLGFGFLIAIAGLSLTSAGENLFGDSTLAIIVIVLFAGIAYGLASKSLATTFLCVGLLLPVVLVVLFRPTAILSKHYENPNWFHYIFVTPFFALTCCVVPLLAIVLWPNKAFPPKRIRKPLAVAVAAFAAILIAIPAFVIFYPDEKLNPDIVLWTPEQHTDPAPAFNLHNMIWGFNAPHGSDIAQAGVEQIRQINEILSDHSSVRSSSQRSPEIPGLHLPSGVWEVELENSRKFSEACKIYLESCFEKYRSDRSRWTTGLRPSERLLIERYVSLYDSTHNTPTIVPSWDAPSPPQAAIYAAHRLYLTVLAVEALMGNEHDALRRLEEDIEFSRWLLKNANNDSDKWLATMLLAQDLYWLSDWLDESPENWKYTPNLQRLTDDEHSWSTVLYRNFLVSANRIIELSDSPFLWHYKIDFEKQIPSWFSQSLMKKNATINSAWDRVQKDIEWSKKPATAYSQLEDKFNILPYKPSWYAYMQNPMGTAWVSVLYDEVSVNPELYNLDGLIMLVNVKKELYQKGINAEDIVSALEEMAPRFHNPYTKEAFSWNPDDRTLSYFSVYLRLTFTSIGLAL